MELTKNKLLILIWIWSLLCVVFTVWITFGTQVQNGFLETLPSFIAIGFWTTIPLLLIVDYFVTKVFWVLAVGGSPCLILSLIGTFFMIGSKNWKVILLYLFFVCSLLPHIIAVFYMRKFFKSCKKQAERDVENARQAEERRHQQAELERERLINELNIKNQQEQVLSLLERQDADRDRLREQLGKSVRKGGRR